MLIYTDTSALAKLFINEKETPDLRAWLARQPEPRLISSALLEVELVRLLNLVEPAATAAAEEYLLDYVDVVEITPPMLDDARTVRPPRLRTLDAIHLATALDLAEDIDVVLTYDTRLTRACHAAGLAVSRPGA